MRPLVENPHAFRKNWPKKKARINREKRHHIQAKLRAALASITTTALAEDTLEAPSMDTS
jgi:hypothetical protein